MKIHETSTSSTRHSRKQQTGRLGTSDGRNQIAIRFNRNLNRNEDSIQMILIDTYSRDTPRGGLLIIVQDKTNMRDSIQVPCDLILIRFKF